MRESTGDLFEDITADAIVIPTNTEMKLLRGFDVAIMGAGLAKAAAERYPCLPGWLADRMLRTGREHVYVFDDIEMVEHDGHHVVCLPTKRNWRDASNLGLIYEMCGELVAVTTAMGWKTVALPRLGCGLGGLDWELQVGPLIGHKLDDRFCVVTPEGV
jgi:O-acetyl-ADP-ribose deacetylase (regulator of RNase III)